MAGGLSGKEAFPKLSFLKGTGCLLQEHLAHSSSRVPRSFP